MPLSVAQTRDTSPIAALRSSEQAETRETRVVPARDKSGAPRDNRGRKQCFQNPT